MDKLLGSSPDVPIGSLISLTSKSEIRYEGVLHSLDTEKLTIVLEDVRSFGTEGRGTNNLQISASSKVYEFIIFRDTDIKDLSVSSFPDDFDKCGNKVREENGHIQSVQDSAEMLKSDSVEIALGWPISPFSSFSQECANWWPWLYSSAASRYNVLPASAPLMFVRTGAHVEPCHSSSSSSLQGNHGSAVTNPLAKFEQVPNVISASVCDSQNLEVQQHLLDQGTTAGNTCISGHSNFQPGVFHQGENSQIKPLKVQPLLQQPLLPLPVSEAEHQRLIKRSLSSGNSAHLRRTRFGARAKARGASHRRGAPLRTLSEASCSRQQFSEDFDFEAMNGHFNKMELWRDLNLSEQQALNPQEEQNGASEIVSNILNPPKKPFFVDDFYDLIPSKDGDSKEPREQRAKLVKQCQIDLETFGVSTRPRRGRQKCTHKGALLRIKNVSIDSETEN